MACALEEVELTKVANDDYIHFGDVIQLVHVETGHVVASDVNDKDSPVRARVPVFKRPSGCLGSFFHFKLSKVKIAT